MDLKSIFYLKKLIGELTASLEKLHGGRALDVVGQSWLTRLQHRMKIGCCTFGLADWGGGSPF